jgi:hypothetical protein
LHLYFNDDLSDLHIAWLSKCGSPHDLRSGSLLLNMVDALARLIPECKTITLHDESSLRRCSYHIDLAELAILLTGMSWYNQFGYKQQFYERDETHNRRIINMPISDAEQLLSDSPKYIDYGKFVECKTQLDATFKLANSSDLTVAEYVKFLYEHIKPYPEDKCDKPIEHTAKLVTYVIKAFGSLLIYNEHSNALTKQVVHGKYVPPFINPSTMTAFGFEPEDVFNCGQCGMVLRGDDLPPWNASPRGVKYHMTRGEGEHEELICHKCATKAKSPKAKSPKAMSPKAMSPKAMSPKAKSPKVASKSPKAMSPKAMSPKVASKSPKANSPKVASKSPKARSPSSALGGRTLRKSLRTRRKPMHRTKQMI